MFLSRVIVALGGVVGGSQGSLGHVFGCSWGSLGVLLGALGCSWGSGILYTQNCAMNLDKPEFKFLIKSQPKSY